MHDTHKVIRFEKWEDPLFPFCDEDDDYEEKLRKHSNNGVMTLVGPMGIVPLNERNMPGKTYNFWVMHSNFDITNTEKDILEKLSGIETLDIFTRYRVRIGIGKVFDEDEVKTEIEKQLGVTSE